MEQMRAARLYGPGDVRIDRVPVPEPADGELLLRVRTVSICPSDWRLFVDGHAGGVVPRTPIIQGHEFSGDVAAVGANVSGFPIGARVAVDPSWPCGKCDMCKSGRFNICRNVVFPSFPPYDGALAEYIACPASCSCVLPDEVGYIEGALVEPLGVAIHAVRLASIRPGETVAILGAGVIGTCVLFLALNCGAGSVVVIEPVAERQQHPRDIGAAAVFDSHAHALDAGVEADVVFECSGSQPSLGQSTLLATPGGRVAVIGIPRDEQITFDMAVARRRELTLFFCRRSNDTLHEAVELARTRRVDFSAIPVRHFSLDQAAEALDTTGKPGSTLRAIVDI